MFTYDCVLAAVLLTTPVESAELQPHLELIQPTFLQLAIDAEVLDAREEQFLHGLSKDLAGDYMALRRRFDALAEAPTVIECDRFPDRKIVEEFLAFNRAYRKAIVTQLNHDPAHADEWRGVLNELDQLHQMWSLVRDVRCGFYYVQVRRTSLQHLRDLVGAEAYYSAQLPPHVPLSHFPRLR